ncbi:replication protein [Bacillus sp. BRMEA1]|uniref:replication protein n=1 Tax=Neobacillus endophyticus TaxID=2738405 RepID=UPI001566D51D|nr:replication protein [Neobacillus endophyticus]NRD81141.1 replication protein [Neobacillus endophyticus]
MKNFTSSALNLEEARYHAWFHHNDSDGWITVAKKTENGKFQQRHYKPEELAESLTNWLGEDVYFSQNTFYKPQRQIENLRQLKALYVDLDFYLFNYDPSWVLGKLEYEFFGQAVPDPNIIVFSGQGIVLIWLLDPVPYKALPLWQAIQDYFLNQLKDLGGDSKAADAARIFRLAGTINSKNGAEVHAQYRHDYRYELRQLQRDYLPELEEKKQKTKGRKAKVVRVHAVRSLHHARILDLTKLVELREYDVNGYRELICFLYRYWLCCLLDDPAEALISTLELNSQFKNPLRKREVEKATKSAEKAWSARSDKQANEIAIQKGYPGAGYNISNTKLINWLDITEEEQTHLKTIIDGSEKRRRKTIANREKRRSEGVQKREDYIKQHKGKTEQKLMELQQILKDNPKAKKTELAKLLGVSRVHLYRLLDQL